MLNYLFTSVKKLFWKEPRDDIVSEIPRGSLYSFIPFSENSQDRPVLHNDTSLSIIRDGHMSFRLKAQCKDSDQYVFMIDKAMDIHWETHPKWGVLIWHDIEEKPHVEWKFYFEPSSESMERFVTVITKCLETSNFREFFDKVDRPRSKSPIIPKKEKPSSSQKQSDMAPLLKEEPEEDGIQVQAEGSLYQFDPASKSFTAISSRNVEITLYSAGSWTYWLWITLENGSELINIRIGGDLNYTQLAGECAFSFATCRPDEDPKSWKFSFDDKNGGSQFMKKLSTAVWQQQHEVRLIKVSKPEKKPLGTKIGGTGNAEDTGDTGETDESSDTEDEIDSGNDSYQWKRQCNKEHSSKKKDNVTNSGVAVGLDSTFVIRGSSLGVFRNLTEEGQLEFETNVSRIQALTGKYIKPAKIMLYRCERFMILQEANEPNLLHQMNLEIGKIDETWYFGPENLVETFAPETKYAQLYDHRTLIGASQNTLYRIDPREPHGKIVSKKSYRHPKKFSSLASTPQGYLAVGSTSGDIRLFDRIGVIAKTHIPKLDEKIRGIDVSNDGRWVLATCSSCLLLVDSQPNEMGNAGINGFRQRFPHKYKPQPLRLRLKENDIKRFGLELMKFTHARFISDTEGVYISSSTGSFLVMWDLQQVLAKRTYPYRILPLENTVVGTEGLPSLGDRVVVAGTNTVNMFSRTVGNYWSQDIVKSFR